MTNSWHSAGTRKHRSPSSKLETRSFSLSQGSLPSLEVINSGGVSPNNAIPIPTIPFHIGIDEQKLTVSHDCKFAFFLQGWYICRLETQSASRWRNAGQTHPVWTDLYQDVPCSRKSRKLFSYILNFGAWLFSFVLYVWTDLLNQHMIWPICTDCAVKNPHTFYSIFFYSNFWAVFAWLCVCFCRGIFREPRTTSKRL